MTQALPSPVAGLSQITPLFRSQTLCLMSIVSPTPNDEPSPTNAALPNSF